jgi:hypothetical protein
MIPPVKRCASPEEYFCHRSFGTLDYEIEGDQYWGFLLCDKGIMDYYAWLARRNGITLNKGSSRGAHVTFVRDEKPTDNWGKHQGEVEFNYAFALRSDNGYHVWLDVWCPRLHEIRTDMGLVQKSKMSFHLTIGRLV